VAAERLPEPFLNYIRGIIAELECADHNLSVTDWAGVLAALLPHPFRCPAPPATPTCCLPGSKQKVAILRARRAQGEGLWHPSDATWEQSDAIGQLVKTFRNGAIGKLDLVQLSGTGNNNHGKRNYSVSRGSVRDLPIVRTK
jgi:hypothetical protein